MEAHGGNIRAAREIYGEGPFLDFSANINPFGAPKPVLEAIRAAIDGGALENYPDPACALLTRAIARRDGVAKECVLCGNGASELLNAALAVLPKGLVAVQAPAFSEYARAVRLFGHTVEFVRLPRDTFEPQLCEKRYTGAILANPNNPTSRALPVSVLESYLERCEWVLLDEAFIELSRPGAAKPMLRLREKYPKLTILRAFTKSLALPGLRLGYAIASTEIAAAMRSCQVPWSVNALAQSVAGALPALAQYEAQTREWLETEPLWLWERLNALPGVCALKPDANFILCRLERGSAEALAGALARRGVLIRVAANFESLDGSFFRVGVKMRKDNERLLRELEEINEIVQRDPDVQYGNPPSVY